MALDIRCPECGKSVYECDCLPRVRRGIQNREVEFSEREKSWLELYRRIFNGEVPSDVKLEDDTTVCMVLK